MSDETVDQVLERIDQLGEVTSEAFEVLVRQSLLEGVTYGIWALLWGAICVTLIMVAKRIRDGALMEDYVQHDVWATVSLVFGFGFGLLAVTMALNSIRRLIHPEFYALRYILRQLG